MAGNIKGITIEIGGNTQPLEKALGDVNKKTRDLQGELKSVERLLKLDPGNTELLAQKQKLLAEQVGNSTEKLNRLKAAQEQVNLAFQRGDIGEEQYRHFQRQVINAEQDLKKFEAQLKDTEKTADKLGTSLKETGEKMTGMGQKMTAGVTLPIAAAGVVLTKGAMDAQAAQGKLQASLGLTAEEAAKLEETAKEVWTDGFGENIEEANRTISAVRKNMGELADQELEAVAEGAMMIADVFEQDVNDVTKTAGVMMKNFGISGQEALDVITVGFQQGGDFSGELLDTLREYSPQFKSLGLTADQAMAMLIAGAEQGAWNLDKVGDAMKEFNIRAQDGSKTTAEGFKAIGLDAEKMGSDIAAGGEKAKAAFMATITALAGIKDPLAQNQAGVALFGTQWEDVRSQVITAMADGVKGLGDFRGATEEATKAVQDNNPGLEITKALREVQTVIGPALLPLADIIKNTIAPAIKSLAEGFASMSPEGQKAVLAIAGIAAAIGPVLIIGGKVVGAVGTISGALGGLGAAAGTAGVATGGLSAAITALTGPVGIAVAAIAALTIGGIALYNHLQKEAIPEVQLFGDETSAATQQAVGAYMDLDEQAGQALMNLKLTSGTVSQETADILTSTFAQMTSTIIQGMEKDFADSSTHMRDYLATSNALSQEEEQKILQDMQAGYEQRKTAVQDGEAQIKSIIAQAVAEKRGLTQQEQSEIDGIRQQMKETAVRVLSETELESKAILERMRQQADELTAQQAATVVKNSNEQKNKAVQAANDQYNEVIKEIIRQRDEAGTISADQAQKLIDDATRQRDETVQKAQEMHAQVVEEAKKQAGEHVDEVKWETGEVKTKWEKLREDLGLEGNKIFLAAFGPTGWMTLMNIRNLEKWEEMRKAAINKMSQLKTEALSKGEELKTELGNIIQRIKDAFANMRIEIPRPKLPRIDVGWKSVGYGEASVKIPTFSLEWYAKGGIFDQPAVIGVGEAGREAVIPVDKLPGLIADALRQALGVQQTPAAAASGAVPMQPIELVVNLDGRVIAQGLYNLQQSTARGRGQR